MTVFGLILMRYFLHYGPISVKKCCVIFCIMRYAIFSLRYTFFKVIMQRTNTENYPLDLFLSGISNFSPTSLPTWVVGLLDEIAWAVPTRLFHNVEMWLDHSRNGLKPFFGVG